MQRTAHHLLLLLAVLFILSACTSGGGAGAPTQPPAGNATTPTQPPAGNATTPTQLPSAASPAPTQAPVAAGPINPRTSEPCAVLNAEAMAGIVGSSLITTVPLKSGFILTCSYEFGDQKRIDFEMDLLNPGKEAYDRVIASQATSGATVEPVNLGDVAAVKERSGDVSLYMVVNGWYAVLYGYGIERQTVIDIGRLLTDRVIAFTPTSLGDLVPTPVPQPGTLIGMEVVIETPKEMAGVTTLESLKIVSIAGFAMCSSTPLADPFIVTFIAPPGQDPPTPVGSFSLVVNGGVTVNQPTPARIDVGLGRSDTAEMRGGEGTVIVAADGKSGTFEAGQIKGRWTCTVSE
jgi:hypothetical protein